MNRTDVRLEAMFLAALLVAGVISLAGAKTIPISVPALDENNPSSVSVETPFSIDAWELNAPTQIEATISGPVLFVTLGPVGQYPSDFYSEGGRIVENSYSFGVAGKLTDWIADAALRGATQGTWEALKAADPGLGVLAEIGEAAIAGATGRMVDKAPGMVVKEGSKEILTECFKHSSFFRMSRRDIARAKDIQRFASTEIKSVSPKFASILEKATKATPSAFVARVSAAFLIGAVIGAAGSNKGQIGITCFKVIPSDGIVTSRGTEAVKFKINNPTQHAGFGDYRVIALNQPWEAKDGTVSDMVQQMRDICEQSRLPAIVQTDNALFPGLNYPSDEPPDVKILGLRGWIEALPNPVQAGKTVDFKVYLANDRNSPVGVQSVAIGPKEHAALKEIPAHSTQLVLTKSKTANENPGKWSMPVVFQTSNGTVQGLDFQYEVLPAPPAVSQSTKSVTDIDSRVVKVESDPPWVLAYVSTTDQDGTPITDLRPANFEVQEAGSGGTITVTSREMELNTMEGTGKQASVALVLDFSPSMDGPPMEFLKDAASAFVNYMKPQDEAAIIKFCGIVDATQDFTSDKRALIEAVNEDWTGAVSTALYDAIVGALELSQSRSGVRALVVFADGDDNASSTDRDELMAAVASSGIPVFAIGLQGSTFAPDELRDIAEQGQGRYYFTPSADQLREVYAKIGGQLRKTYVLKWRQKSPVGADFTVDVKTTYQSTAGLITKVSKGTKFVTKPD